MKTSIKQLVEAKAFEYFIIAVILLSALLIGIETRQDLSPSARQIIHFLNQLVLAIFILEAALKIYAVAPRYGEYFRHGWNIFDFSIVVLALIPMTGNLAMIGRLLRLLRVARLITAIPELRLIVTTLIRSIPSMANVVLLMMVIFYIYAVAGFNFFYQHDPTHWGSLGLSLLTLFRVVTLEDWTDVMYTAMELSPWAWLFFVSFVVIATFVVINLFIAVVINNLDEAKKDALKELSQPVTHDEVIKALHETKHQLDALEQKLHAYRPDA